MRAAAALDALRPEPHRGDQVAAGVVVLATFIYVLETRFEHAWGPGIRLVIDAAATFFAGALAVQSPVEGERPRAYQSILYVATFFLALALLKNLADVLGANNPISASGTIVWVGLALMVLCIWFSARRNSAIMTLLGAISFAFVVEAFVEWVFSPNGASTFRWILLLLILGFALASLNQRGPRPRHGVQFVNAAGLAAVVLGLTFALELVFRGFVDAFGGTAFGSHGNGVGTGWELFLLACGFGLVAYAAVDREPGPAYLGVIVLALFVAIAGPRSASGASLIGWPIVLALMAGGMLVVGLRPSRPLPPAPDAGAPPPPPPTPLAEPPTTPLGGDDTTEIHRP
jgi:hypothetical protein